MGEDIGTGVREAERDKGVVWIYDHRNSLVDKNVGFGHIVAIIENPLLLRVCRNFLARHRFVD